VASLLETPFGELLTGSAYAPLPLDITSPLTVRFAGQTILLLYMARDRAAVARVSYSPEGKAKILGQARTVLQTHDISGCLRSEAAATKAKHVLIAFGSGWGADIGLRAGRPGEGSSPFERYRLANEQPDQLVPSPKAENYYAAVDHPIHDRSIVFSLKQKEVENAVLECTRVGLQVVGVKCAVAAMLEAYWARNPEHGCDQNLLISDGMGVVLIACHDGDFRCPVGRENEENFKPRQAANRPNDVQKDMIRFIADAGGEVVYLGPTDLLKQVNSVIQTEGRGSQIIRPEGMGEAHAPDLAVLCGGGHDFLPGAMELRAPIPRKYRKYFFGYLAVIGLCIVASVSAITYAGISGAAYSQAQHQRDMAQQRVALAEAKLRELSEATAKAEQMRSWVWGNYHAQGFLIEVLGAFPRSAMLGSMKAKLAEGSSKLTLEFTVLGGPDAQTDAVRQVEHAIIHKLRFLIGTRDEVLPAANSGLTYRWNLLIPQGEDTYQTEGQK